LKKLGHDIITIDLLEHFFISKGYYNIKIKNHIQNHNLCIQNLIFENPGLLKNLNKNHHFLFQKLKNSKLLNASKLSSLNYLIKNNPTYQKKSKKEISILKNKTNKILNSTTFDSILKVNNYV
jgi:hypothetical protein